MTQIDNILNRLQGQQPVIDRPDELTDQIMGSLAEKDAHSIGEIRRGNAFLIALRIISSAAAILLIGLFIYVNQPVKTEAQNAYAHKIDFSHSSVLENMYTRYLQASQPKPISYTQVKRMLYAKN
ncbi:MAG: hypothetical protein IJ693_05835 [Bacteroidaceae bacterium]|nr:hypothetical protein [Bacteroidaceae bacterium]